MPVVPQLALNLIRQALARLSGPALSEFARVASGRLGISLGGNAASITTRVMSYVTNNPLSAALVAGSLASTTIDFSTEDFIKAWTKEGDKLPDDIKYILEQIGEMKENRDKILGDADEDTVYGIDIDDLQKASRALSVIDTQVDILRSHFGSLDQVIAVRNALFSLDDASIALYKERHNASSY